VDSHYIARLAVLGIVALAWAAAGACGGETIEPGSGGRGPSGGFASGGRAGSAGLGGTGGSSMDAGSLTSCNVQADCMWGEINREILVAADCPCLYGCPSIPLNRTTVERRRLAYETLCNPYYDGQGRACGIDDCILPPVLLCVQGECLPAE
jgi:hypothetical protein